MNLHIDIQTLQLFLAAVEARSIAKAAEQKNIAASAISKRISDLELLLRVELLHRHSRGIDPTPAGAALVEHARTILGNLARLELELTGYRQGMRGHIRLLANRSAILESLGSELSTFLVSYPMVRIDLEESISPDTIRALLENRADVGVFSANIVAPGLQSFPYREDHLAAVVADGHPLAERRSVRFADLVDHDFVYLEEGSSIDTLCVRAAAELGRQPNVRIRVAGFDALLRLVEARLGIGIAPIEIVDSRMSASRIASIALDEPWATRSLVVGVRDYDSLPQAARVLVEYLRNAGLKRGAS